MSSKKENFSKHLDLDFHHLCLACPMCNTANFCLIPVIISGSKNCTMLECDKLQCWVMQHKKYIWYATKRNLCWRRVLTTEARGASGQLPTAHRSIETGQAKYGSNYQIWAHNWGRHRTIGSNSQMFSEYGYTIRVGIQRLALILTEYGHTIREGRTIIWVHQLISISQRGRHMNSKREFEE